MCDYVAMTHILKMLIPEQETFFMRVLEYWYLYFCLWINYIWLYFVHILFYLHTVTVDGNWYICSHGGGGIYQQYHMLSKSVIVLGLNGVNPFYPWVERRCSGRTDTCRLSLSDRRILVTCHIGREQTHTRESFETRETGIYPIRS